MRELDGTPIDELIDRWRVSAAAGWDQIVGHERAIRRLREIATLVTLPAAERERLGLRLGAGMVISGQPGVGKSLLARAFAGEVGRPVVAPPPGELNPGRIAAIYRALADGEPAVILLDEAEGLIGDLAHDEYGIDADTQRALLAALDGMERSDGAPITLALTTAPIDWLDEAAVRPGRLAPRLLLEPPSAAERAELLRRAVGALPGADMLDLARIAARMESWTGAGIVEAVHEAMRRSLVPGPAGLRTDLLLEVAAEKFTVMDPLEHDRVDVVTTSRHEASHAVFARLAWGVDPDGGAGAAARVRVHDRGGETELAAWVRRRAASAVELRRRAGMSLAGAVGERLLGGADGATSGGAQDRAAATGQLVALRSLAVPFDEVVLAGHYPGMGADAMLAARYEGVRSLADAIWAEVRDVLEPHRRAIEALAASILAAPDRTLAGPDLDAAIAIALSGAPA